MCSVKRINCRLYSSKSMSDKEFCIDIKKVATWTFDSKRKVTGYHVLSEKTFLAFSFVCKVMLYSILTSKLLRQNILRSFR